MATDAIKCKYFPQLPARWYCPNCKSNMANECAKVVDPLYPDGKKICPICEQQLQSIGIANSIKPFWERIPKFFAYPAKFDNLMYIGILSLAVLVGFFIPLVNIGVYILAFFALLRYACKCLYHSAQGSLSPPTVLSHMENSHESIPVKLCGLFIFILFVIFQAFRLNLVVGYTVMAFSLLSIPAITMLLAMTESFFTAINPLKVINIMLGMGKSYLLLYLFLLLMVGSSRLIGFWAVNLISPSILVPFLFFINAYFTVAMFSIMGYAMYQYHEAFGYDGVAEVNLAAEGIDIKASGISQDSFLNEIQILVGEGLLDEAIKRLQKRLKSTHANLIYHDKYHALLKSANKPQEMAEHTTEYINLLLGQAKVNKGLLIGIYADCLKMNPGYFYPKPAVTVDLAKTAQELFKNQAALSLLNNFSQHYPNSEQIPYAYFIVAQLLVDYKQDETQAKKILHSLVGKYPAHELTEQIINYLGIIEKFTK
jgi:hypothetical protein